MMGLGRRAGRRPSKTGIGPVHRRRCKAGGGGGASPASTRQKGDARVSFGRVPLASCSGHVTGRSSNLVVHSAFDVNFWIERGPPPVDVVRPPCCPRCKAASRVPGKRFGLIGHGRRERQLRGPASATAAPTTRPLLVRRYLCRGCGAVLVVVPRQVLARRHFAAGAIALALFLFGKVGASAADAAKRVGSWATGPSAWRTLRRWLAAIDAGHLFGRVRRAPGASPPRRRAERAAMTVSALVPETFASDESARVFAGAALAT